MWMERERKCLHMGLEQRGVGRWRAGDGEGAAISSHEDAVERWGDTAKKKKKEESQFLSFSTWKSSWTQNVDQAWKGENAHWVP